jgi:O-antigen/teichoic acid export membrane protein
VLTAAVNAVAGLWLIPRYGLAGAGWASSLAYLAGAAWMLLRFRGATRLSLREILWSTRADRL